MSGEMLKRANLEGRQADPGSRNPYAGQRALAGAWLLGYMAMMQTINGREVTPDGTQ